MTSRGRLHWREQKEQFSFLLCKNKTLSSFSDALGLRTSLAHRLLLPSARACVLLINTFLKVVYTSWVSLALCKWKIVNMLNNCCYYNFKTVFLKGTTWNMLTFFLCISFPWCSEPLRISNGRISLTYKFDYAYWVTILKIAWQSLQHLLFRPGSNLFAVPCLLSIFPSSENFVYAAMEHWWPDSDEVWYFCSSSLGTLHQLIQPPEAIEYCTVKHLVIIF